MQSTRSPRASAGPQVAGSRFQVGDCGPGATRSSVSLPVSNGAGCEILGVPKLVSGHCLMGLDSGAAGSGVQGVLELVSACWWARLWPDRGVLKLVPACWWAESVPRCSGYRALGGPVLMFVHWWVTSVMDTAGCKV